MKVYKRKSKTVGLLAVTALAAQMFISIGHAQDVLDENALEEDGGVLTQQPIDIDGNLHKKSQADQMQEMRKQMEKQHEEMVQKKIEDIRIKEEQRLGKKLRTAFDGSQNTDQVSTAAAAPQKMEAPAPVIAPVVEERPDFKIIPSFGVKNLAGNGLELESKINAQLSVEAMVSPRISVGLSVGYTSLDMTDVSQTPYGTSSAYNYNSYNNGAFNYNGFYNAYAPTYGTNYAFNNNFYDQNYYNAFGSTGRDMTFAQWSVQMNSKFFIVEAKRIRPYVGLGVSYNRATLDYKSDTAANGSTYTWNGQPLGNEQFRTSYVGGTASLGSEIYFTNNVGLNLDVSYARAITSGINNQSGSTFAYNPDQTKLEQIGKAIEESSSFSLNGGILLAF